MFGQCDNVDNPVGAAEVGLPRGLVIARAVDYDYEDVRALEWVAVHRVPPPGGGQLPLNGLEVDPEAEHEAEAIARYAGRSLRP